MDYGLIKNGIKLHNLAALQNSNENLVKKNKHFGLRLFEGAEALHVGFVPASTLLLQGTT